MTATGKKKSRSRSGASKTTGREAVSGRFLDKSPGSGPLPPRSVTTREAKNRLSAVIREVTGGTDVTVTSDGEPAVVIVDAKRYRELRRHKSSLVDFFSKSPLAATNLDTERSQETGRDIDLS